MKTKNLLIALSLAGATAAGAYGIYQLGVQRGQQQHTSVSAPASAEKKVLYWHDPMSPGTKFDKPGKSPFMDMQLVPVYADADGDESKVTINPRMQQNLGIRLAKVTRGTLGNSLQAVGNVAYNDSAVTLVQARSNGFVEKLYVRTPLQSVRQGEKLAELYVPDWVAAQEEFFTAKKFSAHIPGIVEGALQRMRLAGMNQQQIALVESSGQVQARFTLTAPVGGVVTELAAREGMTVMAGAPLFRINALATVWIYAELAENQASQIRPGTSVSAQSPALLGQQWQGKVQAILPEVNATTRTVKARIVLANPDQQLLPGMFVNLSLLPGNEQEFLLIPSEAVIQTGMRSVVMLVDSPGKFRQIEVSTGASAKGQTEIRSGLEFGQQIVASGQFLIDSEASLKGSSARMSEPSSVEKNPAAASATTHQVQGKIEEISQDELMISHGPVASLKWGAMTMGFKAPASGLPPGLKVGSEISFEFSVEKDGEYRIVHIMPLAKSAGAKK